MRFLVSVWLLDGHLMLYRPLFDSTLGFQGQLSQKMQVCKSRCSRTRHLTTLCLAPNINRSIILILSTPPTSPRWGCLSFVSLPPAPSRVFPTQPAVSSVVPTADRLWSGQLCPFSPGCHAAPGMLSVASLSKVVSVASLPLKLSLGVALSHAVVTLQTQWSTQSCSVKLAGCRFGSLQEL